MQAPALQSEEMASLKALDEDGNECAEDVVKTCTSIKKYTQSAPDGVQSVWHQRQPMSSTFLYQSLLVQQPDELIAYFPSLEQRHQVSAAAKWLTDLSTVISSTKPQGSSCSCRRINLAIHG